MQKKHKLVFEFKAWFFGWKTKMYKVYISKNKNLNFLGNKVIYIIY